MDPISPTLSPGMIEGDHAVSRSTRDAFTRAHARLTKLHAAEASLSADRTLDPVARSAQIHELRSKVAREIKPVYESAYAKVGEALAGLESKISERLFTGDRTASREEIRQHVRRLPSGQRVDFVRSRAKAGDAQTVAAVLTAPAYLSGLDDKSRETLRDSLVSDLHPDLAAEKAELSRVRMRLEHAAKAFSAQYDIAKPHPAAELARARAKAVADASEAA